MSTQLSTTLHPELIQDSHSVRLAPTTTTTRRYLFRLLCGAIAVVVIVTGSIYADRAANPSLQDPSTNAPAIVEPYRYTARPINATWSPTKVPTSSTPITKFRLVSADLHYTAGAFDDWNGVQRKCQDVAQRTGYARANQAFPLLTDGSNTMLYHFDIFQVKVPNAPRPDYPVHGVNGNYLSNVTKILSGCCDFNYVRGEGPTFWTGFLMDGVGTPTLNTCAGWRSNSHEYGALTVRSIGQGFGQWVVTTEFYECDFPYATFLCVVPD
jgi:hypothetical protein